MQLFSITLLITLIVISFRWIIIERKLRSLNRVNDSLSLLINSIPDFSWVKDKYSSFLFVNKLFFRSSALSEKHFADDTGALASEVGASIDCTKTAKAPLFNEREAKNITKPQDVAQTLSHMAYHDELTGLPNRTYFKNRINKLLSSAKNEFAVILFDLNKFKTINDILGHSSGDRILMQISDRLKPLVNNHTTIARLSGDEFAVVYDYSAENNRLEQLLDDLLYTFDSPFSIKGLNYTISASFGVTIAPQDGNDVDTLLKHADLAMHKSKMNNHKHCVYFIKNFADALLYEMNLSNQIHEAIIQEQFSLVYQPKVNSATGALIGVESLLRWEMADGESISPAVFIPIAEKNGFIIELGNWVIKSVLQQLRLMIDSGTSLVPVSINVSAIQLCQPKFLTYLFQQLDHYQIPGNILEIELTEGVLMGNIEETIPLLEKMRRRGIVVSIDDFGTGYSSLSYLPLLPVDRLKIDRAFITNLHRNVDNQKIVQTIVGLANNFNLSVIAEGVETEHELLATNNCGIKDIQGYYYSQPLSAIELERRWLSKEVNYRERCS